MKIAKIAPLYESVPPKLYGGTERVVSFLTEELVRQGHDVTLFASGDSITAAELVPVGGRSLRLNEGCIDSLAHHILLVERVVRCSSQFDVLHFHIDYLHYPVSRRVPVPQVTTLHGRLDIPDLPPLYREFKDMPLVSISDSQRKPLPGANWQATIYHGLPTDLLNFHAVPEITWPFSAAFRLKKESIGRSKLPSGPACRSKLPPRSTMPTKNISTPRSSRSRASRMSSSSARSTRQEKRLPRPRPRALVSDRLARAVRAGHDRSDGLRYAGHRVPRRGRARGDRRRHHGLYLRQR